MSTADAVSGSASGSGMTTKTAGSVEALAKNYDLFLSILTAQMKNQNPLDPTDTNEMTAQLINYSQVEQQILGNSYLENLVLSTNNQSASVALAMVGMDVEYKAGNLPYTSGETLNWAYEVPEKCESIVAQVLNEDGEIVYSKTVENAAGSKTFEWSGLLTSGKQAVDGEYSLKFLAKDADGEALAVTPSTTATAKQVDWSNGTARLIMSNGATVGLSEVISATGKTQLQS
jgi:flagellar basal-body rod modification protein FlgD